MAKAGNLTIDLNANTARLKSDFTKAQAMVKKYQRSARRSLNSVSKAVFSIKGAVLSLAGAGGFGILISSSLSTADALAKTADKIGITTEALGGLHHATTLFTSAGAGAMNEALTKASKRLGEFNASGGGAAAKWLEKLNLDTQYLAKLAPDQLFKAYAESVRGLSSRGEQLAAVSALMGDESRQLIGLIDAMPSSIAAAEKEARELGLTFTRLDAAKIEAANDSITKVKGIVKGAANSIAIQLAPVLEYAAKLMVNLAKDSGGFGMVAISAAKAAVTGFGKLMDIGQGLKVVFQGIKVAVLGFTTAFSLGIHKVIDGWMQLANLIPGIDLTTNIKALDFASDAVVNKLTESKSKLKELMAEPMPSIGILDAFEQIKVKAHEAAEAVALAKVKENEDRKIITEENYNTDLIFLQNAHVLEMLELKKHAAEKEALEKASAAARLSIMGGVFTNLASLMNTKSKTLFKIGKVAAISSALVNTYQAVTKTMAETPYPWNIPLAAAQGVAGMVQVNKIRSTSFGGGGGVSVGGGAAASAPNTTSLSPGDFIAGQQQQAPTVQELRVVVDGDGPHSEGMRKFAENLAETIKDMGGVGSLVVS